MTPLRYAPRAAKARAPLRASGLSTVALRDVIFTAAIAGAGLTLALLFHAGVSIPRNTGIIALYVLTVWGLVTVRITHLSLLPRFMLAVYALPFTALAGYLWTEEWVWTQAPQALPLTRDFPLMSELVTVGVIGVLGLIAGFRAARIERAPFTVRPVGLGEERLTTTMYVAALVSAIFFSWLSSPPETIFAGAYSTGQSGAIAGKINFPAAYLFSYVILLVLTIDAEREVSQRNRRAKLRMLGVAVSYIVVVLQILRGDRESSGLIAALASLYITSPAISGLKSAARESAARARRLFVPGVLLTAVYIALGSARWMLSDARALFTPQLAFQSALTANTWTAVLWTNLGMAWEHREGAMVYKLGNTYVDYLLSLPPGFVTKLFGYARPLEFRDLSREALFVSAGGLHAVVTPFKNFGAAGVLFVLGLYGYAIGRIEANNANGRMVWRLLWASTFASGFLWFWYGEMPFIRALMFTAAIYFAYRVALSIRVRFGDLTRTPSPPPTVA